MFRRITTAEAYAILGEHPGWVALQNCPFTQELALYCLIVGGKFGYYNDTIIGETINYVNPPRLTWSRCNSAVSLNGDVVAHIPPELYGVLMGAGFGYEEASQNWLKAAKDMLGKAASLALVDRLIPEDEFGWANWFMKRYDSGYYDPYLLEPRNV